MLSPTKSSERPRRHDVAEWTPVEVWGDFGRYDEGRLAHGTHVAEWTPVEMQGDFERHDEGRLAHGTHVAEWTRVEVWGDFGRYDEGRLAHGTHVAEHEREVGEQDGLVALVAIAEDTQQLEGGLSHGARGLGWHACLTNEGMHIGHAFLARASSRMYACTPGMRIRHAHPACACMHTPGTPRTAELLWCLRWPCRPILVAVYFTLRDVSNWCRQQNEWNHPLYGPTSAYGT